MVDTRQTRRRLLQTAGVAIGSSIVMGTASADHEETWTFHAELTTEAETHDVDAPSSGHATFEIPPDDHRIHYTVDVEWLCDGTQAHIHLGEEGEDGPVVAWLYPEEGQEPELIEGRFDGTLAEGTMTVEDLVGPLEGASEEDLMMAILSEDAYVNVHTEEHPAGEIRGQIRPDADTERAILEAMEDADAPAVEETEEEEDDDSDGDDEGTDGGDDDEMDDDDYDEDDTEDSDGDDYDEDDDSDGANDDTSSIRGVFDSVRALFARGL